MSNPEEQNPLFDTGAPQPDGGVGRWTVTGLTRMIKALIESSVSTVVVEGEISNYVHHSSGHRYFTLKDENCQLRCVMFKWQAASLAFVPEEGMKVQAVGSVTVYERGGQYQLNTVRLRPLGRGDLLARLEELKKKLSAVGIFDNNRPLPVFPRTIGVVTSPTGAAIRDIVSVITRRAPHVRIVLRPTLVQGVNAAPDIVAGIEEINGIVAPDVLIVGRGGGSMEDLWCFNDERVARAVAASAAPVISAVGHETDVTLCDFAADLRVPTPSAAAEMAVRDVGEMREKIRTARGQLRRAILARVEELSQRVDYVVKGLQPSRMEDLVGAKQREVGELSLRLRSAFNDTLSDCEKRLGSVQSSLAALNPRSVLARGYSIVYRAADGAVVSGHGMVGSGDAIRVELGDGGLAATVDASYGAES